MSGYVGSNAPATPIMLGLFQPPEGPKAIPLRVPFSNASGTYTIDLQPFVAAGKVSAILSAFIDNSGAADATSITTPGSGQVVTIPPASQAYVPIIAPKYSKIEVSSTGTIDVPMQLLNIYMAPCVWSTEASGSTVTIAGGTVDIGNTVAVSGTVDLGEAATVIGQQQTMVAADATEVVNGGTAVTVFAAAEIISGAWIQNPPNATDVLIVNTVTTAASAAGGNNIALAPGAMLTLGRVIGAVSANSVDAAHTFAAVRF